MPSEPPSQSNGHAVPERGIGSDLPVLFSPVHAAIPGDGIVGIIDPGRGVTIYPVHAGEALSRFSGEPERWIDVSWDLEGLREALFPVGIRVLAHNEKGVLAQIASTIAALDANIDEVSMTAKDDLFSEMALNIEVRNCKHLEAILERLRGLDLSPMDGRGTISARKRRSL